MVKHSSVSHNLDKGGRSNDFMRTANSLKQGEQEQVQSAGGYHLVSNQENIEKNKSKIK